ncbi:hypothetical protein N599_31275 [Saccharopolyspora erythraea D]|nr:hypothetical protein N599_31275 [Saccharopolyspora erythraea D]
MLRELGRLRGDPAEIRGLRSAFWQHTGRELDSVLSEHLSPAQFDHALTMLGFRNDFSTNPAHTPPKVVASPGQKLSELPQVRAFAEQLRAHVEADEFDEALVMLRGLDRNLRAVWAVQDAYHASGAGILSDDLKKLRPEHSQAVFDALAFVNGNAVSLEQAIRWHQQLKTSTFEHHSRGTVPIRIDYPDQGCNIRAHLWSLDLQRMGAEPSKVFVTRINPKLTIRSSNAADSAADSPGVVSWEHHVAPTIVVHTPQGPQTYVFDPVLSEDVPLSVSDWLAKMGVDDSDGSGTYVLGGSPRHIQDVVDQHYRDHPDQWAEQDPGSGYFRPSGKTFVIFSDPSVLTAPCPNRALGARSFQQADDFVRGSEEDKLIEFNDEAERRAQQRQRTVDLMTLMGASHQAGFNVFSADPSDPNSLSYNPVELWDFVNESIDPNLLRDPVDLDAILGSNGFSELPGTTNVGLNPELRSLFAGTSVGFDPNALGLDLNDGGNPRGMSGDDRVRALQEEAGGFGESHVANRNRQVSAAEQRRERERSALLGRERVVLGAYLNRVLYTAPELQEKHGWSPEQAESVLASVRRDYSLLRFREADQVVHGLAKVEAARAARSGNGYTLRMLAARYWRNNLGSLGPVEGYAGLDPSVVVVVEGLVALLGPGMDVNSFVAAVWGIGEGWRGVVFDAFERMTGSPVARAVEVAWFEGWLSEAGRAQALRALGVEDKHERARREKGLAALDLPALSGPRLMGARAGQEQWASRLRSIPKDGEWKKNVKSVVLEAYLAHHLYTPVNLQRDAGGGKRVAEGILAEVRRDYGVLGANEASRVVRSLGRVKPGQADGNVAGLEASVVAEVETLVGLLGPGMDVDTFVATVSGIGADRRGVVFDAFERMTGVRVARAVEVAWFEKWLSDADRARVLRALGEPDTHEQARRDLGERAEDAASDAPRRGSRRQAWPATGSSRSTGAEGPDLPSRAEGTEVAERSVASGPVSVADVVDGLEGLAARASGETPVEPGTELLGPDVLGLRGSEPLAAVRGRDYSGWSVEQAIGYLLKANMLRGVEPTWEEMDPANLANDAGIEILEADTPQEEIEHWRSRGVPESEIPAKRRIPLIMHSYWVGDPLRRDGREREEFMGNIGVATRMFPQLLPVLWTDVPRRVINDVLASEPPSDGSADPHADVREVVEWARRRNIVLANVWEFPGVELRAFFETEMFKLSGPGFAGSSDVFRSHLDWFGGFYTDGDNQVESIDFLDEVLEAEHGFALQEFRVSDADGKTRVAGVNSALVAAHRHPFFRFAYRPSIVDNYAQPQSALFQRIPESERRSIEVSLDVPHGRARRYSTLLRTVPEPRNLLAKAGLSSPPLFRGITKGNGMSWAPAVPRAAESKVRADDLAGTVELTAKVVHTLIRDIYNREGDLHLPAVESAIKRHEDPRMVLTAALQFIASRPELASRVSSVTDLKYDNGETLSFALPDEAQGLLEYLPDGAHTWFMGEGTRPVVMVSREAPGHEPVAEGSVESPYPVAWGLSGDAVWAKSFASEEHAYRYAKDRYGFLAGVNRFNYFRGGEGFRRNCLKAVVAFFNAVRLGRRFAAGSADVDRDPVALEAALRSRFRRVGGFDEVKRWMRGQRDGAGAVVLYERPGKVAHAIVVVRHPDDGVIDFVDPQVGSMAELPGDVTRVWLMPAGSIARGKDAVPFVLPGNGSELRAARERSGIAADGDLPREAGARTGQTDAGGPQPSGDGTQGGRRRGRRAAWPSSGKSAESGHGPEGGLKRAHSAETAGQRAVRGRHDTGAEEQTSAAGFPDTRDETQGSGAAQQQVAVELSGPLEKVVRWRPESDGDTLWKYLVELGLVDGSLDAKEAWPQLGSELQKAVRRWAIGMAEDDGARKRYSGSQMARLSGDLITKDQANKWRLRAEPQRPEVVRR